MSFAPLTADTTARTADSTVLTADMTQYEVAEAPRVVSGGLGRVPSRLPVTRRPDEPRDISAKVRARLLLAVKAEAFGSIEHAAVIIAAPPKQKPQPVVERALLSMRANIFAELHVDAAAVAAVKHAFRASIMASFGLAAHGSATGALEPELVSPEVLLALLVALDDGERYDA